MNYQALFQQSSAMMIVIDTNFTITSASDAFLYASNTKRDKIIGYPFFNIFSSDAHRNEILTSFNRVLETKSPDKLSVVAYRIPELSGEGFDEKYFKITNTPTFDSDKNVEYIIQVAENAIKNEILTYQLAQEKLDLKLIGDSEKRYNKLLMGSPFGFAILRGPNMVITLANNSIKEYWGKEKNVEGKPLFDIIPELKDSQFPNLLKEVYETGKPFYGDELLAPLIRNKKLEDVYFNFIYQPYLEADETISGVTIIAYEVTPKALLKKALAEQREAEQKSLKRIEESNRRYYSMLMESPFAFSVMKGNDMVITLANDLIKEFWGKGNDVENKTLIEVLPELENQPFPEIINQVYETGIPHSHNEVLAQLSKNGRLEDRYFNVVYQPLREEDQIISGVTIIAYEVTEQVLSRKKIEENEAFNSSVLNASPDCIKILDTEGRLQYMNENGISLLEIDDFNSFKNKAWMELWDGDNQTLVKDAVEKAANGEKVQFQALGKTLKGTYKWWDIIVSPMPSSDNKISGILGVSRDITAFKEATLKVQEVEHRFRNMMETIPQISWTNTVNGEFIFFNQRWYDYTGINNINLIAQDLRNIIHPNDLEVAKAKYSSILKSDQGGEFQIRGKREDGFYRWHLIRLMPIKSEDNEDVQLWVGTATDIEELRLLQQQKDDFISIASHELKTPITSLKASLQIMNKMKDNPSSTLFSNLIARANVSIEKVGSLVENLLNTSKANEGQIHLNKKQVKLSTLADDCCHHIRDEGNYTINTIGDIELEVFADSMRIDQVITNFVNNAIKYAPKSKEVTIKIEKIDQNAKVSVIDKGPGIEQEKLRHLFDRYYRVDSSGIQYSGLGLGLYISAEIIKRHHGQIGVDSELGKGSTFWFTLPI